MTALKTILYFSIFKYPLTRAEIFKFTDTPSIKHVDTELNLLLERGIIFKFQEFYTPENNPKLVTRRLNGNAMAEGILPKAFKMAKRIAKFPYVESVSLSGALSKGYYDNDGDVDFFIITTPNRLWVARTLLVLYKKIFLLNSKKYFCVNYFISTNHLKISEQNRFTATELVTLVPVYGKKTFQCFIDENQWAYSYFPNIEPIDFSKINDTNKSFFSKAIELACNTSIGNYFDSFFRQITLKKWHSKFGNLASEDFKVAMKSTKHVSKHHPQNFQKKVIDRLNLDYTSLRKRYNLELHQDYA